MSRLRCRWKGHQLRVRNKQDWGRELPQAAVLPGSDAGNDGVKPASFSHKPSDFALHVAVNSSVVNAEFIQLRRIRSSVKERYIFVPERLEPHNTSPQAIEFNTSCSEQAYFNRPGTGHGYESTNPGS